MSTKQNKDITTDSAMDVIKRKRKIDASSSHVKGNIVTSSVTDLT